MEYTTKDVVVVLQAFGLASSTQSVHRLIKSGKLAAVKRHTGKKGGVYHVVTQQALEAYVANEVPLYPIIKEKMPHILHMAMQTHETIQ